MTPEKIKEKIKDIKLEPEIIDNLIKHLKKNPGGFAILVYQNNYLKEIKEIIFLALKDEKVLSTYPFLKEIEDEFMLLIQASFRARKFLLDLLFFIKNSIRHKKNKK